ncbi:hypothetical protein QTP86_025381, partial [Hemibagrus guttatus]
YLNILPQSKDMHDRLIGISKLSVVCDCVSFGINNLKGRIE